MTPANLCRAQHETDWTVKLKLRTVILWVTIALAAAFGAASIHGALLGPEAAKEFFNSPLLIAFWFLLLGVLVAGTLLSPGIFKRPASLLMHVGPMLIIVGSMLNSNIGHRVGARMPWLFDANRVPVAQMQIPVGRMANFLTTAKGEEKDLPFALYLREFLIDYYPPRDSEKTNTWQLWVQTIERAQNDEDSHQVNLEIPWELDKEIPVPHTGVTLKVLEYIPSARPVFSGNLPDSNGQAIPDSNGAAGVVTLFMPDDRLVDLPVIPGKEFNLPEVRLRLKIGRLFTRARFSAGFRELPTAVEDTQAPVHPALELQFFQKDGNSFTRYALTERSMPPRPGDMLYSPAEPTSAVADANTGTPAMKLLLRRSNGSRAEIWLVGNQWGLTINNLLGNSPNPADENGNILMMKPHASIKTYRSDIEVIENGKVVKRQAVEVNHPLHYGGYDFYQFSYGQDQQSTVLNVTSDQGLLCVWIGFALICGGAAWHCWVVPVSRYMRRGGKHVAGY